ncbi:MAG TPA: hypothetical protein VN889_05275 [Solirubrobacteraceae bacterium]|nr:hypothetical protein [Solirubrobacteraceae bacterium]
MTFDESFDERTERQHREATCAGVVQSEPDQPIGESTALQPLFDLGVDERDQAGLRPIGGEADDVAVDRKLIALTIGRVSQLDALWRGHAARLGDPACELRARLHIELAERLAQVMLDGALADEQLSGDLPAADRG